MSKIQRGIDWVAQKQRFGMLVFVQFVGTNGTNPRFKMVCDCGRTCYRGLATLRSQDGDHCGCQNIYKPKPKEIAIGDWGKVFQKRNQHREREIERDIVRAQTGEVWDG